MTKLLILEHSKSVRNNLCERLEFEGYATRAVETAAAAEVIAGQEPFDLVIADDIEPLSSVRLQPYHRSRYDSSFAVCG